MRQIHTYSSSGIGSVNSFVLETEEALIGFDAQRHVSDAKKFVESLKRTEKPMVALFLTHEHPDHLGGLGAYHQEFGPDLPIYLTRVTEEAIRSDSQGFIALTTEILKEEFSLPDRSVRFIEDGEVITFGNVSIRVHDLGPAESESTTCLEILDSGTMFCGDLVTNKMTPLLFERRTRAWIRLLEGFDQRFPHIQTLYCGHGEPDAASTLVTAQIEYLRTFRTIVAGLQVDGTLTVEQQEAVGAATEARYPGYVAVAEIPKFIENNAIAVAKEIYHESVY